MHDGPLGRHAPLSLHPGHAGGVGSPGHLGWIVPNHALRRTAQAVASRLPGVRIEAGAQVSQVHVAADHAAVEITRAGAAGSPQAHRERLQARLVVAADSRFSAVRQQLGIGVRSVDFGRTVIVCRMRHALPHRGIAHEAFGYDRTLAVLPLPDDLAGGTPQCSVVVTTGTPGTPDAAALMAQGADTFAAQVEAPFQRRLGAMRLVGERHAYPLVATYADRFAGHRCALIGDAAVGMHPVTAHGFNLGLAGVASLVQALTEARRQGRDIGEAAALQRYARDHHRRAWPIYQGTNAIVRLYTDARPLPRAVRHMVLQGAQRLPPLKAGIVGLLTERLAAGHGAGQV
ncbi:FAD-dependent monooxygenase [Acidovorax sp. SUPP3334]|uniref:FAD-dependent monooxygenase n=1 Tax=Acidovorax sp. SUPP3334 TaxID=2920881 RepID=UPI0023DE2FCA|nr:FAD-dependent monooxygenase [Acidovorax sp. SUPP3334]GKT24481.1 5-demethoxyubiquinol-8 5-hydroxylase UbiM [Acidovorax sp. SUPP3334]